MSTPNHSITTTGYFFYSRSADKNGNGAVSNVSNGSGFTSNDFLSISSINTPGFYRLRKKDVPFHNYGKTYSKWNCPITHFSQRYYTPATGFVTYTYVDNAIHVGASTAYSGLFAADDSSQKVNAKLLSQLNQSKTNLGVTIAEAHKTAAMVVKTASRLARAYKSLLRVDIAGFSNALGITLTRRQVQRINTKAYGLKAKLPFVWTRHPFTGQRIRTKVGKVQESDVRNFAAQTWLEFTYGWKPLLNDLYTTAEASAKVMMDRHLEARSATASTTLNQTVVVDRFFENKRNVYTATRQVFYKAEVYYKLDGQPSFANVFGLQNPLTIAWELVPFSFVVDWFLPVGNFLESLTATNGLIFLNGWFSKRIVYTYSSVVTGGKVLPVGGGSYWEPMQGSLSYSGQDLTIQRGGLNSFPVPSFPSFKDPRSFSHAASAIALLQSLFLGKAR